MADAGFYKSIISDDTISLIRRDNCFDFLRYLFAFSLILAHFCTLTDTEHFWFITGGMRVKAFFTITGFLVTYSLFRCKGNYVLYFKKRLARIMPAYLVCIAFCLFLGLVVTTLGFLQFFQSGQTFKYFLSNFFMLNWIEPELPNTFQGNPEPQMNGSLWSMKLEVIFYLILPLLVLLIRSRKIIVGLTLLAGIAFYSFLPVQAQYFVYFISGMALLYFFEQFNRHKNILLLFAIAISCIIYLTDSGTLANTISLSLEPISFPIILLWIAYNLRHLNFIRKFDNITYGLYLYHFPIIQLLIHLNLNQSNIYLCFIVALAVTSLLAYLSWTFIEKPIMKKVK